MKKISTYAIAGSLITCAVVAAWVLTSDQNESTTMDGVANSTHKDASEAVTSNSINQENNKQSVFGQKSTQIQSRSGISDSTIVESDEATAIELMVSRFNDLLYVDSPNFSMEKRIAVEEQILQLIRHDPEAVFQLFDMYEKSEDHDYKLAVVDVLSMTENPHIENFALDQVNEQINDHTLSWLQILRSTGISSQHDRAQLLSNLYQFSEPVMLSNAISTLKYRPIPADESERQAIVSNLQMYLTHEHPLVRKAANDVTANWNLESRI
jgi:hypothetical protein